MQIYPSSGMLHKFISTEKFGVFIPEDKYKTQLVFFKKDRVARYYTRCDMLGHFASNCMQTHSNKDIYGIIQHCPFYFQSRK